MILATTNASPRLDVFQSFTGSATKRQPTGIGPRRGRNTIPRGRLTGDTGIAGSSRRSVSPSGIMARALALEHSRVVPWQLLQHHNEVHWCVSQRTRQDPVTCDQRWLLAVLQRTRMLSGNKTGASNTMVRRPCSQGMRGAAIMEERRGPTGAAPPNYSTITDIDRQWAAVPAFAPPYPWSSALVSEVTWKSQKPSSIAVIALRSSSIAIINSRSLLSKLFFLGVSKRIPLLPRRTD